MISVACGALRFRHGREGGTVDVAFVASAADVGDIGVLFVLGVLYLSLSVAAVLQL